MNFRTLDLNLLRVFGAVMVERNVTRAAAQLRLFAREIVWLNPLLRFDRFEPRAGGVRALLPFVDRFLPVHNLASLADLAVVLRERPSAGRRR